MAAKITGRRSNANKDPIWRAKLAQFTWASTETAAITKAMPVNGLVKVVIGVANDSDNGITYTTAIVDEDSYTLYSKADWAENATEVDTLDADTLVYVPQNANVTITPSGDPGASGGTFDITFIGV